MKAVQEKCHPDYLDFLVSAEKGSSESRNQFKAVFCLLETEEAIKTGWLAWVVNQRLYRSIREKRRYVFLRKSFVVRRD